MSTDLESLHEDEDIVVEGQGDRTEEELNNPDYVPSADGADPEPKVPTGDPAPDTDPDPNADPEPAVDPDFVNPRNLDPNATEEITDGINSFLAEFNIENGIIQIEGEDGKPVDKPFSELTESEKFNVLKSLSASTAKSVEEQHALSPDEIEVLNGARDANIEIKDYIEGLAQQRAKDISAISESSEVNFDSMTDDAIFIKFIKDSSPESSEEDIAEELANAKNGKLFKGTVGRLRESFKQDQQTKESQAQAVIDEKNATELEEQRTMIVNSVVGIEKISEWPVSDDDKNQVLEKMLELNAHGDPIFMEEVFSDPKEFFKAAWLYYNADSKFDELTQYFKGEQTKAFNRGFDKASKGMSPEPLSGSRSSSNKKPEKPLSPKGPISSKISWDELDDD